MQFGYAGRMGSSTASRGELRAFLELGLSVIAATRDDRMVAELTRCAGARIQDDGRVYVVVPLPEGQRTLHNVVQTGVIALTCALPTNYQTVALKGRDAVQVEWPAKARTMAEHEARFTEIMIKIGLTETNQRLWSTEAVTVAFTPLEFYDQTPGPSAGSVLPP